MFYVLDEDNKPKKVTLQECGAQMNNPRNIVAQHRLWPWFVSTVFLGINHNHGSGDPILFETMVFRSGKSIYEQRYISYDDAKAGHQNAYAKYFFLRAGVFCAVAFAAITIIMMAALVAL